MKNPISILVKAREVPEQDGQTIAPVTIEFLRAQGFERTRDGYVTWRPDATQHPRNWPLWLKLFNTGTVVMLDANVSAMSTAIVPGSHAAGIAMGISPTLTTFIWITLHMLGQAIGGIIFPPYSESFGRKNLYVLSATLSTVCCIISASTSSIWAPIWSRLVCGFLSAIPSNVVAGTIEDLWDFEQRTWAIFSWALAADVGVVCGTVIGNELMTIRDWRFAVYFGAILLSGFCVALCFAKETRPSLLLSRHVAKLRRKTGDATLETKNPDAMPNFQTFMRVAVYRPLYLLVSEPIVFLVSFLNAIAFGIIYFFSDALMLAFEPWNFNTAQAAIPFVAVAVGMLCGSFTRLYDSRVLASRARQNIPLRPEDKLTGFSIGVPCLTIGLWIFAWTIPPHVNPESSSWGIPVASLVLVGYGIVEIDTVLSGYMADSYIAYAASAFGSLALLRALFSGIFPLFGASMFATLGNNLSCSVLAGIATAFCCVPPLFLRYGEAIRKSSRFATYTKQLAQENLVEPVQ